MTEYEKSLITKTFAELNPDDAARILGQIADSKRILEVLSLIPKSDEEYNNNTEEFLVKYGINLSKAEADFLVKPSDPEEKMRILKTNDIDKMPESFFRYRQFMANKVIMRDKIRDELCVPDNETVKKWRARQVLRCDGELGGLNKSFVHTVACYELSTGCSVGCKFCGLSAGKLSKLFRYTPENEILFKGVLKKCHEIFGDAAGFGMMYLATEPLDNPDYEQFENLFYEEFHIIPQITTAIADRNIERTRRCLAELNKGKGYIHRFTVRSLEMAERIFQSFSATELLFTELIPQYPQAPGFIPYVKVGRENEDENISPIQDAEQGTICCVDGICVNFPDKHFRLISPCRVSEENPKGIIESENICFEDAEDFERKLRSFIEDNMKNSVPKNEILSLYDFYYLKEDGKKTILKSRYGDGLQLNAEYMITVVKMLMEGKYTRDEIVREISSRKVVPSENVYWFINKLWDRGIIRENILFCLQR